MNVLTILLFVTLGLPALAVLSSGLFLLGAKLTAWRRERRLVRTV